MKFFWWAGNGNVISMTNQCVFDWQMPSTIVYSSYSFSPEKRLWPEYNRGFVFSWSTSCPNLELQYMAHIADKAEAAKMKNIPGRSLLQTNQLLMLPPFSLGNYQNWIKDRFESWIHHLCPRIHISISLIPVTYKPTECKKLNMTYLTNTVLEGFQEIERRFS